MYDFLNIVSVVYVFVWVKEHYTYCNVIFLDNF